MWHNKIRLYSRDMELTSQNILHHEMLAAPVIILSIVDNSLLVYMADNTLQHYLIVPTADSIKLHLCGSITFTGIIAAPNAVRMLSWMIPGVQKRRKFHSLLRLLLDMLYRIRRSSRRSCSRHCLDGGGRATYPSTPKKGITSFNIMFIRSNYVYVQSANDEVKYDIQVFADRIEFCWIHLRGIGALENSLWAYDGDGMRVWLNALSMESPPDVSPENVKESVKISLDFYPLCESRRSGIQLGSDQVYTAVLMDKGIIIGVEYEAAIRSNLPFVLFRHATSVMFYFLR